MRSLCTPIGYHKSHKCALIGVRTARGNGVSLKGGFDEILQRLQVTVVGRRQRSITISMKLFSKTICEVALFDAFRYQHLLMPLRL